MDRRRDPLRIFKVIEELDADMVGLQEAIFPCHLNGSTAQNYLRKQMGYELIPGPTVLRTDTTYGNALLTRHPVKSVGRVDLSVGIREPRGALYVDMDLHGMEFRVIVTHLGLQALERRRQIEKLFHASIDDWQGTTILMGDFNEWIPKAEPNRKLIRHFGLTPAPKTFPSRFPLFSIDRIWVLPRNALLSVSVPRTNLVRKASDHLPVLGKICL